MACYLFVLLSKEGQNNLFVELCSVTQARHRVLLKIEQEQHAG